MLFPMPARVKGRQLHRRRLCRAVADRPDTSRRQPGRRQSAARRCGSAAVGCRPRGPDWSTGGSRHRQPGRRGRSTANRLRAAAARRRPGRHVGQRLRHRTCRLPGRRRGSGRAQRTGCSRAGQPLAFRGSIDRLSVARQRARHRSTARRRRCRFARSLSAADDDRRRRSRAR